MVSQPTVYGGFWVRAVAVTIDFVILVALILMIGFIDSDEFFADPEPLPEFDGLLAWWAAWVDLILNLDPGYDNAVLNWLSVLVGPVYFILFNCLTSATPGKLALGLVIVDAETGEKPTVGQFIGRNAAAYLSTVPLCLGYLWVAWDKKKQGFHDRLAVTLVVKKSAGPEKAQAPFTYSEMHAAASSEDSSEES